MAAQSMPPLPSTSICKFCAKYFSQTGVRPSDIEQAIAFTQRGHWVCRMMTSYPRRGKRNHTDFHRGSRFASRPPQEFNLGWCESDLRVSPPGDTPRVLTHLPVFTKLALVRPGSLNNGAGASVGNG